MRRHGVKLRPMGVALHEGEVGLSPLPPRGIVAPRIRFGFDVLRATAILLVLVSHAGGFLAGWLRLPFPHVLAVSGTFGVELFFVLSGFLVGRILLRTLATRPTRSTLGRFLLRRWMRTLPLYWLAVLALAVLQPPAAGTTGRDIARYASFTQNLLPPQLDWFFPVSWTLAVEEWFYAGFALLLWAAGGGRRGVAVALGMFLAGPPVARLALFIDPAQYRIVPFWLDCIGWGVFAAAVAAWRPPAFQWGRRLAGPALVLTLLLWADETARFTPAGLHRVFGFGAIAATLALLLPAAEIWPAPRSRVVAAPVRWLSTRSYGIYITHATILQWIDARQPAWGPALSAAAACVAIGVVPELTWRLIERPFIAWRPAETSTNGMAASSSTNGKIGET